MKMMRLVSLSLCGAVAVALGGCGVVHAAGGGVSKTAVGMTSPGSPGSPAPARSPKQRADADAAAMLAVFVPPPGARKLAQAPDAANGALETAMSVPGTPDLVDDVSWWLAPGDPATLLGWEKEHVPATFTASGSGTDAQGDTVYEWEEDFTLPSITGVLDQRELMIQAVAAGNGQTAIRVDAQVTWTPARPAGEKIPSGAKAVTISEQLGMNQGSRKPPRPVTITRPATVRMLVGLIDGLPLAPPGRFSCPADFDDNLTLTFRAKPGGPALAVAIVELSGCVGVDLSIGGKQEPGLVSVSGPQILKIAGLLWQIPVM